MVGTLVKAAWRESRGSFARLVFLVACLALGTAAVSGVGSLSAAIEGGLRAQARELLGADLSIESRRGIPPESDALVAELGPARATTTKNLATMASHGGRSRLVDLKAIGPEFPFHGRIVLDPPRSPGSLAADECAVAPEVLEQLGARLGDQLKIGEQAYTIASVVREEPGRLDFSFTLGPRVLVGLAGLEAAKLEGFGRRVVERRLWAFDAEVGAGRLERLKARLLEELPDSAYLRVETARDAQPALRRSIERVEDWLALVALLSLCLGGAGVAQLVHSHIDARAGAIAVQRALGLRPREVLQVQLLHVAGLALLSSTLGAALGAAIPFALPWLLPGVLPEAFALRFDPWAPLSAIAVGVLVALFFALPPVLAAWRVPPARALRHEAEPLPAPRMLRLASWALLAIGVLLVARWQGGSWRNASAFAGALVALSACLWAGAKGLIALARAIPRRDLPPLLLHGVAALARPGRGTAGAVVALGIGVLVVAGTSLVERRMSSYLANALPPDAPSAFFVDVQPDQREDLEQTLREQGAESIRAAPIVTARLARIDGRPVAEIAAERKGDAGVDRELWVLTREQRLTFGPDLPSDNEIVAGSLWNDPARAEVSIEERYAEDLGAGIGSVLTMDVQGRQFELLVSSIRKVRWESFGINFFLQVEPGVLESAPHQVLVAARLPIEHEEAIEAEVALEHPNITAIRVRPLLVKALDLLSRLAVGVRVLGSFVVLVGIAILAGVVGTQAGRRVKEVGLLKAIGCTRREVVLLVALEHALQGIVAGALGGVAAFLVAHVVLEEALAIPADLPWSALPALPIGAALLAAGAGLAGSWRALRTSPIEALRG
jgi:putative ABC transport system permease protein